MQGNRYSKMMEAPSIKLVTESMLAYWAQRATEAKHPIMQARYADLVWDFTRHVTGKPSDPNMARLVIDATLQIAERNLHKHEFDVITKLERALSLALSLNDRERLELIRDTIIAYEDSIAKNDNIKRRGFSFDLLLENNKVPVSETQEKKIIDDLESWLDNVSNIEKNETFDPFAAEEAANRLAKYYRKLNDKDKVREVLLKYGNAFLEVSQKSSALVGSSWLKKVYQVYRQFELNKEAEEIAIHLRRLGEKSKDEMKVISGEVDISKKEIDEYITAITEGELQTVLNNIVSHFIPRKDEVEKEIKEISKKAVLSFLMPKTLQDHKGRPIAEIGPLHEDLDGHIVSQMSQNLSFSSFILRQVIEKIKVKFNLTANDIVDYLYKSPLFDIDKKQIIEVGLKAYFENDHLVAVHLLIPQIEDALRNLVEKAGGSVYKLGRSGGFFLKNLDEILRDGIIIKILGEDVTYYLRVLLTDPRGWNLRNDVCHGISPANYFQYVVSDRIFHALILLGLLKEKSGK